MRQVIIIAMGFIIGTVFFLCVDLAYSKEEPKKDDMLCVDNAVVEKTLVEKGYDILLNMTNENGVVESVWAAGQSIVITAAVPNEPKSCVLANMSKVTFNPKAIEEVWETYKKQTKQKDI